MSMFPIILGGGGKAGPLSLFAYIRRSSGISPSSKGRFITGLFFCALLAAPVAVNAQGGDRAAAPKAQIITDEDKGTVTIVIEGKPVMQIDANGLQVVGDVTYGGMLTDAGREHVAKTIAGGDDAR